MATDRELPIYDTKSYGVNSDNRWIALPAAPWRSKDGDAAFKTNSDAIVAAAPYSSPGVGRLSAHCMAYQYRILMLPATNPRLFPTGDAEAWWSNGGADDTALLMVSAGPCPFEWVPAASRASNVVPLAAMGYTSGGVGPAVARLRRDNTTAEPLFPHHTFHTTAVAPPLVSTFADLAVIPTPNATPLLPLTEATVQVAAYLIGKALSGSVYVASRHGLYMKSIWAQYAKNRDVMMNANALATKAISVARAVAGGSLTPATYKTTPDAAGNDDYWSTPAGGLPGLLHETAD